MQEHYLEMKEVLTEQEDYAGVQPVFIRVRVTGKADAIARKSKYTAEFAGRSHKDTHHICNHGGGGPCGKEDITEDT